MSTRTKKAEPIVVVAEKAVAMKPPHKGGWPDPYSREIAGEILARMGDGETVTAICRDPRMPNRRLVMEWARDDRDGFAPRYRAARELQGHAVAEEVLQGARDATDANLGRLRMDAGKWFAAKLLPRIYSDRVAIDQTIELAESRSTADIAASIAVRQARLAITDDN